MFVEIPFPLSRDNITALRAYVDLLEKEAAIGWRFAQPSETKFETILDSLVALARADADEDHHTCSRLPGCLGSDVTVHDAECLRTLEENELRRGFREILRST